MSFSFEFISTVTDAPAIVDEQHAPDSVKQFIKQALSAFTTGFVSIVARGHLYDGVGSYQYSSATIEVKPIIIRTAEPPKQI